MATALDMLGMQQLLSSIPGRRFLLQRPYRDGAMRAILKAGLQIPEDVAIIGCGNVKLQQPAACDLSSVD